jgi:hypothetical protein
MTDREHIPQEDLALYAMQALSTEESAAVRAHLESCAECRAEVAEATGDLALVAMSVDQHALPEGARQRFVDRIAADAATKRDGAATNVVPIEKTKTARPVYSSIQWSAVAALLVLAFAMFLKVGALNRELREKSNQIAKQAEENSRAQRVLEVLTGQGTQRVLLTAAKAKPAPSARAVYLASNGGLILQASDLDPLPEGKTYELWVIPANGTAPIPAGLFRPDAAGSATVILPQLPVGVAAKAFGVTIERAEGSQTPTAPIVLSGAAPAVGE